MQRYQEVTEIVDDTLNISPISSMINAASYSMIQPNSKLLSKLLSKSSSLQPLPITAASGTSKTLTRGSLKKISSGYYMDRKAIKIRSKNEKERP